LFLCACQVEDVFNNLSNNAKKAKLKHPVPPLAEGIQAADCSGPSASDSEGLETEDALLTIPFHQQAVEING
jgi:hypothetical protein